MAWLLCVGIRGRDGARDSTFLRQAIRGFWGTQRGDLDDTWDVHKSGYDFALLRDLLEDARFVDVRRLEDMPKNLTVVCRSSLRTH